MTTIPPAFTTDDRYDRENASNGRSRYGAYLDHHRHLFLDDGVTTADVVWFAFSAWEIASSPIMAPGYLRTHPRVLATEPCWDDDSRPALAIRLAAPHTQEITRALGSTVRGWEPYRDVDGEVIDWLEPWHNDRLSAYATLTVRVPVQPDVLPTPRYRSGVPDTATAQHAVKTLCALMNPPIGLLVAVLGDTRGGR